MNKPDYLKIITMTVALVLIFLTSVSCTDKGTGDGEIPKDGVLYSSTVNSGDYFYTIIDDSIVYLNVFDTSHKYNNACANPLCQHDNDRCPAFCYSSYFFKNLLIVDPEERTLPLMYMFGRNEVTTYKDGESIKNPKANLSVIKEFDMSTNNGRVVTDELPYRGTMNRFYYNGVIYCTAVDGEDMGRIVSINVKTGEIRQLDYDLSASVIGIYDKYLYFNNYKGILLRCDLKLKKYEELYDCKTGFLRKYINTPLAMIDGNYLYFESNCREAMRNINLGDTAICDVYRLDLDNIEEGAKLIAEGVHNFYPYNGDLYYTLWDYKNYGELNTTVGRLPVYTKTGSTLYKYDTKTDTSSVFIKDCGAEFDYIYAFNDKYIIFEGLHFDDIETLGENEPYIYSVLNVYCFDTGKYETILMSDSGRLTIK